MKQAAEAFKKAIATAGAHSHINDKIIGMRTCRKNLPWHEKTHFIIRVLRLEPMRSIVCGKLMGRLISYLVSLVQILLLGVIYSVSEG